MLRNNRELHDVFWQDGLIFLDNEVTFPDLAALIEHYYSHPLPHHGSLCLQKPYANLLSTWWTEDPDIWFLLWRPCTAQCIWWSASLHRMKESFVSKRSGKVRSKPNACECLEACKESNICNIHAQEGGGGSLTPQNMKKGKLWSRGP